MSDNKGEFKESTFPKVKLEYGGLGSGKSYLLQKKLANSALLAMQHCVKNIRALEKLQASIEDNLTCAVLGMQADQLRDVLKILERGSNNG